MIHVNKMALCILVVPVLLLAQASLRRRWVPHVIDTEFTGAKSVYAADLDNDNDQDVLGAASALDEIAWWENNGNGGFSDKHIITSGCTFNGAYCVRAADLNGDGYIDVLGIAHHADLIAWWENDGASPPTFYQHIIADSFNQGVYVQAVDLDNDDDFDVIATGANDESPTWWENDGAGCFFERDIPHSEGILDFSVEDIDGDGDNDIVGTYGEADAFYWFENNGESPPEFIEQEFTDYYYPYPGPVYATDLDSDGDIDVVFSYDLLNWSKLLWWRNNGGMNFTPYLICAESLSITSIYVTSLDCDNNKDILITANSFMKGDEGGSRAIFENNITWWKNDGSENFTGYIITRNYYGAGSGYATRIDNDFYEDVLASSNILGRITWWENNPLPLYKPVHRSSAEEESGNTPSVLLTIAPINSRSKVNFSLTLNEATNVDLSIYDAIGRKTETLVSQSLAPGTYNLSNKKTLSAGIYFYSFKSPLKNEVGKLVMIQ